MASPQLAVAAVGGYGRGELSLYSDIDLLVLVTASSEVTPATVRGLLYPLWDAGFEVGHAVRTPKETIDRAAEDLDAATSILSARFVGGNEHLFEELVDRRSRWLTRDGKKLARRVRESTQARHARVERAGWVLAPDLKEDVGGLRDVHRLGWLRPLAPELPWPQEMTTAAETLMAVREALHAQTGRRQDRARIDLQRAVARSLGLAPDDGANELMHEVHSAARTIEHIGSLFEQQLTGVILGGPKRSGAIQKLTRSARVDDGVLTIDKHASRGLGEAMDLLAQRAHTDRRISNDAARWLAEVFAEHEPAPWAPEVRAAFFDLLRGPYLVDALELLDHSGGWPVLMPEWLRIRALAQHDPYHRYTVDGHLFVTAAEISQVVASDPVAASAADEAGDLDDLRLAALLHDIGKGSGEDHSVAGERLALEVCRRIGLDDQRSKVVSTLVRRHLTLVDTATRRDLDDGGVIAGVVEMIGDPRVVRLLYILTVADARATGPEGWNDWKAALVRDLYKKTLAALETGSLPVRSDVRMKAEEIEAYEPGLAGRALEVLESLPPSYLGSTHLPDMVDDVRLLLTMSKPGQIRHRIEEGTQPGECALTLCIPDRPGALARTAGVLSLHRLPVLRAQAFSTTRTLGLQRFVVSPQRLDSWDAVIADLEAAYSGRLALEARLERKIRDYVDVQVEPDVRILQDASDHSSVIEVRTTDALGLLYAIATALGDLDLDIHVAKIDTLGARVVDVFYVRTEWGTKLSPEQEAEVERAIRHRLARLYG